MSLLEQIEGDLIVAIKTKDEPTRDVLRFVKSNIKNYQINEQKETLSDDEVTTLIGREVKKRKESIEAYKQIGKEDLATDEQNEINILEKYLPQQLSEAETTKIISDYISAHKNESLQIGQVIGALSQQLKGKADMSFASKVIKEQLGS